jgi:NMD protein affecting ribosome stability and mRNA decay
MTMICPACGDPPNCTDCLDGRLQKVVIGNEEYSYCDGCIGRLQKFIPAFNEGCYETF